MNMKKLGKVTIKANGEVIESYPGAEIGIGGIVRNDKDNGHHPGHFSETQKAGHVKAQFDIGPTTSLRTLEAMEDVTLICELDTGQSYVGNHFYVVEVPDFTDGSDSKVEIEFRGPPMEEMSQ
ncbi:MAG: hypothetical protein COA65_08885 [Rhodospirillaceae bacterium]|nr:MAG: hypothetical protein COA65_08885 [Rhodospirillaceae bacterium]